VLLRAIGQCAGAHRCAEAAHLALDRSLLLVEQVDRNANLGLAIQKWCEDLAGVGIATACAARA